MLRLSLFGSYHLICTQQSALSSLFPFNTPNLNENSKKIKRTNLQLLSDSNDLISARDGDTLLHSHHAMAMGRFSLSERDEVIHSQRRRCGDSVSTCENLSRFSLSARKGIIKEGKGERHTIIERNCDSKGSVSEP
jgi:hypothetical protein